MNIMALLCLGSMGQQGQALKMSEKVDEKSKSMSETLISSLVGSELDLATYVTSDKHAHDQQNVQTNVDSEEEDDDEDDDEDELVQIHKKNYGRDENGMFNNHKNYMKLRNKINEQETSHSEMFDTINKKLTDQTFIQ